MTTNLLSFILVLALTVSCSIKRPGGEEPAPTENGIEKSFFTSTSTTRKSSTTSISSKVFIAAWAPVTEVGSVGEASEIGNAAVNYHANVVFEIEEDYLLGKLINPSYPDDSTKWETIVTIPISKHYYYEKKKDQYGRETTDYIENSSRSHWSARPDMKLNFSGTKVHKWAYALQDGDAAQVLAAEDIEIDESSNFLAFTLTVSSGTYGSDRQAKYRFNFLPIDPDGSANFVKTPYHSDNAQFINILHVIGRKVDGINEEYLAAHWDFTKKINLYLYDFPERYQEIAKDAVELWNDEFEKMGFNRPLVAKFEADPTYYFDLRKPSMTWMGDKRISYNSPLGIGQAQANIFTGEIVWGGVMIWGGALENYLKSYAPLGIEGIFEGGAAQSEVPDEYFLMDQKINFTGPQAKWETSSPKEYSESSLHNLSDLVSNSMVAQKERADYESEIARLTDEMLGHYQQIMTEQKNFSLSRDPIFKTPSESFLRSYFNIAEDEPLSADFQKLVTQKLESRINPHNSFDSDVTFSSVSAYLSNAMSKMRAEKKTFSIRDAMQVFLKDLIIHELGHLLGLGHNFKENILPKKGSVPDKYYNALKGAADNGMKNYSTVMGYRNPLTVLDSTYEEIMPGPHDMLALHYLYLQEYPTYNEGDEDFTFVKLGSDGKIDKSLNVSYFPACNDMDASYYRDPFCNRHARGYNAKTIMQTHFDSIDYLVNKIQAVFTEYRSNHDAQSIESSLWGYAVSNMSRIRQFYDYMRLKYKDEIYSLRNSESNLLYFSKACENEEGDSGYEDLDRVFANNPQLKELCQANKYAIEKMTQYLSLGGSDYSTIDRSTQIMPGSIVAGDADMGYDQYLGSWTSISPFYLKLASLYTLTQNYSYMLIGSMMGANWEYSTYEDGAYTYFTLYPFEMTNAVSDTVMSGVELLSDDNQKARISKINTYLGSMLTNARYYNNDQNLFVNQGSYFDKLFRQHQFSGKSAIILLQPNLMKDTTDKVYSFEAAEYQQFGNIPLGKAYVLPNRRIIVDNTNKMILPLSEVFFGSKDLIYVPAIILDYTQEFDDKFSGGSAKTRLTELYADELRKCIGSGKDGLSGFFNSELNSSVFEGITLEASIGSLASSEKNFYDSLSEGYEKYKEQTGGDVSTCLDVYTNLNVITNNAMIINDSYTVEALKFINKN